MRFTKMQALGNDYLYFYGEVPDNVAALCRKLCDRHFGAGADGLIFIAPSASADFSMRIFNADGSEAEMCGNGIRCVGKYVYDKGYTDKERLTVSTAAGLKTLLLETAAGVVRSVQVDMGKADVFPRRILELPDRKVAVTPVGIGNPHAVIFTDDAERAPVETVGRQIEKHPSFPDGVNVEFVGITGRNELRMRVWERGSGVTLACGTGACASAAAAVTAGLCDPDAPILVRLDGGNLTVNVSKELRIRMTGGAETVYEGEVPSC